MEFNFKNDEDAWKYLHDLGVMIVDMDKRIKQLEAQQ